MSTLNTALTFGIEIETTGIPRIALATALASVVGGSPTDLGVRAADGRHWQVVADCSLSGGWSNSGEVVSPILTAADFGLVAKVVEALGRAGARVDRTCGIHIHVGAEALGYSGLTNLVRMVAKHDQLIAAALSIDAQRRDDFCKPTELALVERIARSPRNMEGLALAWYNGPTPQRERYHRSRYHGLNLHSVFHRGTVEFRWFNGSLDPATVTAYLHLVMALAERAREASKTSGQPMKFDAATAKYDFRCLLLKLGMIGDAYKASRKVLLANLEGSAAWKHGRPMAA